MKNVQCYVCIAGSVIVLLAGCNAEYLEEQLESVTSPSTAETVDTVLQNVKEGTAETLQLGEQFVREGTDSIKSTVQDIATPSEKGQKTESNLQMREQLMEEAGGQMIDELRGSPLDDAVR
jgi:hypothetical protein